MTLVVAYLRLQVDLHRFKALALLFYGYLLPYLIFRVADRAQMPDHRPRLLVGLLLCSATLLVLRHVGHAMESERTSAALALVRTTPFSKRHYLAARGVESFALAAAPLLLTCLLARASNVWFAVTPRLVVSYGLWVLSLCACAVCVSSAVKAPGSMQLLNVAALLTSTLCPLFYPAARTPQALRVVVDLLPPSLAMQAITTAPPEAVVALCPLAVWTVSLIALAVALCPWGAET